MFREPRRRIGSCAGGDGFRRVTLCVGFLTLIGGGGTVGVGRLRLRAGLVTVGVEIEVFFELF
jgi:hypothetical protein